MELHLEELWGYRIEPKSPDCAPSPPPSHRSSLPLLNLPAGLFPAGQSYRRYHLYLQVRWRAANARPLRGLHREAGWHRSESVQSGVAKLWQRGEFRAAEGPISLLLRDSSLFLLSSRCWHPSEAKPSVRSSLCSSFHPFLTISTSACLTRRSSISGWCLFPHSSMCDSHFCPPLIVCVFCLQTSAILRDMCVVFAGPFPAGFSQKEVRRLFRCCGPVHKIRMLNTAVRVRPTFSTSHRDWSWISVFLQPVRETTSFKRLSDHTLVSRFMQRSRLSCWRELSWLWKLWMA